MKKIMRRLTGLLAVLFAGFVLVACTTDDTEEPVTDADDTPETTETTETTGNIGFSISTLNNPFFVTMSEAAEDKAGELGVNLSVVDAGNDPAKQTTDIEDLINTGIDVLIINPEDSSAVGPAVQIAIDEGIKIIAVDREVEGAEVDTYIGTDNVQAAEAVAEELLTYLEDDDEVIILEGVPGASSSIDRVKGFMNVLEGQVNIVASQTANFDRTEGLTVTENLLQAHPNVRAIVAANDEMALGAIEAIIGANLTPGEDILVAGFDATDDAVAGVEEGTMLLTAQQEPARMAELAVETALKMINGEDFEANIPVDVTVLDINTLQ